MSHPVEEWTDEELIDQYRYLEAETEDMPVSEGDDEPIERLLAEIRRRGLESALDEVDPDAASPGREDSDPHLRR